MISFYILKLFSVDHSFSISLNYRSNSAHTWNISNSLCWCTTLFMDQWQYINLWYFNCDSFKCVWHFFILGLIFRLSYSLHSFIFIFQLLFWLLLKFTITLPSTLDEQRTIFVWTIKWMLINLKCHACSFVQTSIFFHIASTWSVLALDIKWEQKQQ